MYGVGTIALGAATEECLQGKLTKPGLVFIEIKETSTDSNEGPDETRLVVGLDKIETDIIVELHEMGIHFRNLPGFDDGTFLEEEGRLKIKIFLIAQGVKVDSLSPAPCHFA